jgi:hypothetical protein
MSKPMAKMSEDLRALLKTRLDKMGSPLWYYVWHRLGDPLGTSVSRGVWYRVWFYVEGRGRNV